MTTMIRNYAAKSSRKQKTEQKMCYSCSCSAQYSTVMLGSEQHCQFLAKSICKSQLSQLLESFPGDFSSRPWPEQNKNKPSQVKSVSKLRYVGWLVGQIMSRQSTDNQSSSMKLVTVIEAGARLGNHEMNFLLLLLTIANLESTGLQSAKSSKSAHCMLHLGHPPSELKRYLRHSSLRSSSCVSWLSHLGLAQFTSGQPIINHPLVHQQSSTIINQSFSQLSVNCTAATAWQQTTKMYLSLRLILQDVKQQVSDWPVALHDQVELERRIALPSPGKTQTQFVAGNW